jgi:hypothetical protein
MLTLGLFPISQVIAQQQQGKKTLARLDSTEPVLSLARETQREVVSFCRMKKRSRCYVRAAPRASAFGRGIRGG